MNEMDDNPYVDAQRLRGLIAEYREAQRIAMNAPRGRSTRARDRLYVATVSLASYVAIFGEEISGCIEGRILP